MNFIKNQRAILKNVSLKERKRRKILLDISEFVLKEISPEKLLQGALPKKSLKNFNRVVVIGIGKAGRGMAKRILSFLGRKPDKILFADSGHPLPTAKGIKNTARIIRTARKLGERDLALILISGGGSSMLVSPVPEISLQDKIKITQRLLRSGANISEMNIVRKHLSKVKGGNLAALLYPATVWGLVISDVVGNDLSTIASGPLSPDKSTFVHALKILKKYRVKAPKRVFQYLQKGVKNPSLETPKPGSKYFKKVTLKIIGDHKTVLGAALRKAKKMRLRVHSLGSNITGEAREVARHFVVSSRDSRLRGNDIIIGTGETTVTCRGKGFGGRNQEFVLAGFPYLKPHQTLASIATDGVDGMCPEPICGAIADYEILKSAKKQRLRIPIFLNQNNSYEFFKKTGGLIKTGPTGTNLGDLMMLLSENP